MPSFPFWLSFLIGFLSLSEEILWVRTVSFAYHTLPPTFSFVLVCYLVGIALGAAVEDTETGHRGGRDRGGGAGDQENLSRRQAHRCSRRS